LPVIGFNVYDGLKHEKIVLTRSAVAGIQERLLG
jgi:ribosomal protein L4